MLNIVFNDLNNVSEVWNTSGIIKEIIHFFRDSTVARKIIPNIPLHSERVAQWNIKLSEFRRHFPCYCQSFRWTLKKYSKFKDQN